MADSQSFGDSRVVPIFDVLQQQNFGIARSELFQGGANQSASFVADQPLERVAGRIVPHAHLFDVAIDQFPFASQLAAIQQRLRDREAVEPRRDLRRVLQRRLLANGGEPDFLHHFIHAVAIAEARENDAPQPAVVAREFGSPVDGMNDRYGHRSSVAACPLADRKRVTGELCFLQRQAIGMIQSIVITGLTICWFAKNPKVGRDRPLWRQLPTAAAGTPRSAFPTGETSDEFAVLAVGFRAE